MKAVVKLLLQ